MKKQFENTKLISDLTIKLNFLTNYSVSVCRNGFKLKKNIDKESLFIYLWHAKFTEKELHIVLQLINNKLTLILSVEQYLTVVNYSTVYEC